MINLFWDKWHRFLTWGSNFYTDIWNDGLVGKLWLAILTIAILVLIFDLTLWLCQGLYLAADTFLLKKHKNRGTVVEKFFIPEHEARRVALPGTGIVPDQYNLRVQYKDKSAIVNVPKQFYGKVTVGNRHIITFRTCRISGILYVDDIQ